MNADWEALVAYGAKAAREFGPGWVGDFADEVEVLVRTEFDGPARELSLAGLDAIRGNADRIAGLAAEGLVGVAGLYWTQGEQAAREAYLRHHATGAELLEAADAIGRASVKAADGSGWEGVLAFLEALGGALPALLPLLVALV